MARKSSQTEDGWDDSEDWELLADEAQHEELRDMAERMEANQEVGR